MLVQPRGGEGAMPPATRSETTRSATTRSETSRGGRTRRAEAPAKESPPPSGDSSSTALMETTDAARDAANASARAATNASAKAAADAAAGLTRSGGHLAGLPVAVARTVVDDVASTARRPDAVIYWGGLAGLAALGVLEWPVAAALGVGVAVAGGRRRRTGRPGG